MRQLFINNLLCQVISPFVCCSAVRISDKMILIKSNTFDFIQRKKYKFTIQIFLIILLFLKLLTVFFLISQTPTFYR